MKLPMSFTIFPIASTTRLEQIELDDIQRVQLAYIFIIIFIIAFIIIPLLILILDNRIDLAFVGD